MTGAAMRKSFADNLSSPTALFSGILFSCFSTKSLVTVGKVKSGKFGSWGNKGRLVEVY